MATEPSHNSTNSTNFTVSLSNIVKNNTSSDLSAKIKSISVEGLVTVEFNQLVDVPKAYTSFNQSVLVLTIKDGGYVSDLNFTWNLTSFTPTKMLIQLHFADPSLVSLPVTYFLS